MTDPKQPMTFVTVWEVAPEDAQQLYDVLVTQTHEWMVDKAGFLRTRIFMDDNRERIVSATEWDDRSSHAAVQALPDFQPYLDEALEIAQRRSMMCHEISVIEGKGS